MSQVDFGDFSFDNTHRWSTTVETGSHPLTHVTSLEKGDDEFPTLFTIKKNQSLLNKLVTLS